MNNVELATQFLLQIAVILFACRVVGMIARRLGQPQVVAEMFAGILLGPSLLGMMAPEFQDALFPWDASQGSRDTQSYLYPVAQLGLALYMFVVGLEFRLDIVRAHFRSSLVVSLAGMIVPFILGALLAWFLFLHTNLFPSKTTLLEATLFLGASLCITAFPMLARIIQEKGLSGSLIGAVSIGAGAINDISAWCLLALVFASIDDDYRQACFSIGGGIAFALVAWGLVRPALKKAQRWLIDGSGTLSEGGFALSLGCLALGAWFTEGLHLHAVFGAFVVGSIIPRGAMQRDLLRRIQPLSVTLLLPLFFAYSGLNTKIGLLDSSYLWGISGLVLAAAIAGKGGACWLAARITGISNRDALGIGTLMNARGLMELIIINIGLQRGVISEELFTILVIMAVATTLMTSPIFDLVAHRWQ